MRKLNTLLRIAKVLSFLRERRFLLFFSIWVISIAFSVSTSGMETVRVSINQSLADYWRTTYDILVRPPGSRSPIEEKYGLVQANHLSNLAGGITFEQYEAIKRIPGIEVVAPIAMISYFDLWVSLAPWLKFPGKELVDEPGFYVEEIILSESDNLRRYETKWMNYYYVTSKQTSLSPKEKEELEAQGINVVPLSSDHLVVGAVYKVPVLLAAIDPEQESKLINLDSAIVLGAYLDKSDTVEKKQGTFVKIGKSFYHYTFPIIINLHSYVNAEIKRDLWRIELRGDIEEVLKEGIGYLERLPHHHQSQVILSNEEIFRWLAPTWRRLTLKELGNNKDFESSLYLPSAVQYEELKVPWPSTKPVLKAVPLGKTTCLAAKGLCSPQVRFRSIPKMVLEDAPAIISGKVKGAFDIEKLSALPPKLAYVPLETYHPPMVKLIYDAKGTSLKQPISISPTFHPESYIQRPPLILTTLKAAKLFNPVDPISAIRVRVGGIDRFSPEAQAKIEAVAAAIVKATGLTVDIVVGSSPRKVIVYIPGYGEIPSLGYVEELWIQKGVTLSYGREIKRVNWLFFGIVLAVCGLNIFNTTILTILGRCKEIALRKAIGWCSSTVLVSILMELCLLGAFAGGLGVFLGWILSKLLKLNLPLARIVLLLPLGIILCLIGGLIPAWLAFRIPPADLLQRKEVSYKARVYPRSFSITGYALRSLWRQLGRYLVVIISMALGSGFLTILLCASVKLHGYLNGTLLGKYLLLRISSFHYLLAGVSLFIASITTWDVLMISTQERRREIGILKAMGWQTKAVFKLFLLEGIIVGILGGVLGATCGLAFFLLINFTPSLRIMGAWLAGIAFPVVVTSMAAIQPALTAMRVHPADALRYE